jgi:CHC2 zinc finger
MSPVHSRERVEELRHLLVDVPSLCGRLGLDEGARRQAKGGLMIRCPWHAERTPSCSVRHVDGGGIVVHCFGCDVGGDAFSLIAVANGLDTRKDFFKVLHLAAELAGVPWDRLAGVPWDRSSASRISPIQTPRAETGPKCPPTSEVVRLWDCCRPVGDVMEVAAWLRSRALDVGAVEDFCLAKGIPSDARLPWWASLKRRTWLEIGHWLLVPMFDQVGAMMSLRARQVVPGDGPKSLAPARSSLGGLVMADARGRKLLQTARRPDTWPDGVPLRIVVAEGEPDFLTWATQFSDADATAPAVIGVVSGSWTSGIADRIPTGTRVIIRTDGDDPGKKYAKAIYESLRGRCTILRGGVGVAA